MSKQLTCVLLMFLLFSTYFTITAEAKIPITLPDTDRFYINLEGGVAYNAHSGSNDSFLYKQKPWVAQPDKFDFSNNSSSSYRPMIGIAIGHILKLNHLWSLDFGAEISYIAMEQKGKGVLDSEIHYSYKYNINISSLLVNIGLNYQFDRWLYTAKLSVGAAMLDSNNYRSGIDTQFSDQSKTNFAYGIKLGIQRFISNNTSIGLAIGYYAYGKAKLGPRVPLENYNRKITIEQSVNPIVGMLVISHWF